ncbi:MAG: hypothetical protein IKV99_05575 [Oscillospiraceae bacterium]|nr:hypothetical protein [Oscillospiraceae bacterium]
MKKVHIAPAVPVLLAVLLILFPPVLLLAIFSASLLHELGHYAALRLLKGSVKGISITPLGAEMDIEGRMSYGQELLLAASGPAVNLLLAVLLSHLGTRWELCYLLGGVHLVLGLFNLLPVMPLDGGMLLWNASCWCLGPYTADRISTIVGMIAACLLTLAALWMLQQGGSPFLLLAAVGLLRVPLRQIGLVKQVQTG